MRSRRLIIFLIVLLSVFAVVLSIFFISILTSKSFNISSKVSNKLNFNKTYDTIFNDIIIDSKSSDIKIKEGQQNKIKVLSYGKKNNFKVKISNNQLNIISKEKSCIGFCFNLNISRIEIYLPHNYSKNIKITNKYGDVKIGNFNNMVLDIDMNAGDIEIGSVRKSNIKNKYGNINITNYSNELNIKENSGDVNINEVNNIKVINKYGNININKINNSLDIVEESGDIRIKKAYLKENSKIKNSFGNIKIDSIKNVYINAKTNLGDTKINKNYPKSDITLIINNNSGDIKVN